MDKVKRKGRHVCCYYQCKNKGYESSLSFYSFPREYRRAKAWLEACKRPELLSKLEVLHKNYRVCSIHFQEGMFVKGKRRLLRKDAIPKPFITSVDIPPADSTTSGFWSDAKTPYYSLAVKVQQPVFEAANLTVAKGTCSSDPSASSLCSGEEPLLEVKAEQPAFEAADLTLAKDSCTPDPSSSESWSGEQPLRGRLVLKIEEPTLEEDTSPGLSTSSSWLEHQTSSKCLEIKVEEPTFLAPDLVTTIDRVTSSLGPSRFDLWSGAQAPSEFLEVKVEQPTVDCLEATSSIPLTSSCSVQTSQSLTAHSPRKKKLRKSSKELQQENAILKKENQYLSHKCHTLENEFRNVLNKVTLEQYKELTYRLCPSKTIADFINIQITEIQKSPQGRRFSNEFKSKCLSVYFSCPKLYRTLLTKLLCLPSAETLGKLISKINISPGLHNPSVFGTLKLKMNSFNELHKYCVLCVDEIKIKPNIFYASGMDSTVGIEDHGMGKKKLKPARVSTVLMVKSLFSDWKQPLGYFFSNATCPGTRLKEIVFDAIKKLKDTGLHVVALVCDMAKNNVQLKDLLKITAETPFFFLEEQQIFFMFDVPHLLKSLRNVLLKYDFVSNDKVISWKHLVHFYEHDTTYNTRAAPKLTDSHISPNNFQKLEIKYAVQVFSASVKAALSIYIRFGAISPDAEATSDFIERMDHLFDLLNSSSGSKEFDSAFKGLNFQIDLLNESLHLFENLKIIDRKGSDVTDKIKFRKGFRISISALLKLWDYLQSKNISYLFTRRLNQDCLETFFDVIRQRNGYCVNPTANQFKTTFGKLFCAELLNYGNENFESDEGNILPNIGDIIMRREETSKYTCLSIIESAPPPKLDVDYQLNQFLETNFVKYFPSYLLMKCKSQHSCPTCDEYANSYQNREESTLSFYYEAHTNPSLDLFRSLNMPHNDFVKYISLLEVIFQLIFERIILGNKVIQEFMSLCKDTSFAHPCKSFPRPYLIRLFSRVRIFFTLKLINRNFKSRKDNKAIIWKS